MTNLCRILVFLGFSGTLLGVLRNQGSVVLMSLGMLFGIFLVAVWFHGALWWYWRTLKVRRLVAHRELDHSNKSSFHESRIAGTLWEGRCAEVEFLVESRGLPPGDIRIDDLISPKLIPHLLGDTAGVFGRGDSVRLRYSVCPVAAGTSTFFGIRFVFYDPFGLFVRIRTRREVFRFQTLPEYDRSGEAKPIIKRVNALPRQGIHTLQRAGLGSELLELREYQTGDPPKSIAWKVSARRDMLMTRQYQAEVPVRIQLLLEGAEELRRGVYGERPLDWMRRFAASLTSAAVQVGDPMTVTLVGNDKIELLDSVVGDRGFQQALQRYSAFTEERNRSEMAIGLGDPRAVELAIWLTRQWAPDLLDFRVNVMLQTWFPILTRKYRLRVARRALTLVFAEVFRLPTKTWMRMSWDDGLFWGYLEKYVEGFEFPTPSPLLQHKLMPAAAQVRRYTRFAKELQNRIARAKDNQVFVIVSTAFSTGENDWMHALEVFTPAIKLAVARHHRVVVVGVVHRKSVSKESANVGNVLSKDVALEPNELLYEGVLNWAEGVAERRKIRRVEQQLKRAIGKLGATFVVACPKMLVRHVMVEAELAGRGRTSRAIVR